MHLTKFQGSNIRNFSKFSIEPSPKFNILVGENGSGKTTLLEAIYLMGLGRSFRTHQIKRVVREQTTELAVFGLIEQENSPQLALGIEKATEGTTKIRLNGQTIKEISKLAALLPLQVINNDSFALLTGGAKCRRQFIDWGLFHVERQFFPLWKKFYGLLKQRNALLRDVYREKEIVAWDKSLVPVALILGEQRKHYMDAFLPLFSEVLRQFLQVNNFSIEYKNGWDEKLSYDTVLTQAIDRDLHLGYTQFGPHRADLVIKVNKFPAQYVLSRGQQKLLVFALKLTQGLLLQQQAQKKCIYLLDDLPAELDKQRLQLLAQVLVDLDAQVFMTGVDKEVFDQYIKLPDSRMFHVEHGVITM